MSAGYPMAAPPDDPTLSSIADKYKALAPHVPNMAIVQSPDPGDERQLEYYHPTDDENPKPGKITMELFKKMAPKDREDAVAGDALHYLGGHVDENETVPVDPRWQAMKQGVIQSRTPDQQRIDHEAFAEEQKLYGIKESFDDWMQHNRSDAYIRAGVFPQQNPEWHEPRADGSAWFTPQQTAHFQRMSAYLQTGRDPQNIAGLPDYGSPQEAADAMLDPRRSPAERDAARAYIVNLGKR